MSPSLLNGEEQEIYLSLKPLIALETHYWTSNGCPFRRNLLSGSRRFRRRYLYCAEQDIQSRERNIRMDDQIPKRNATSSSLSGTALLIKFRALRTEQAENAPQDSGGHYRQIHLNSRHSNANGPLFSNPPPPRTPFVV
ncbi:hypothetical protein CEXT_281481 [Caerostris extrusa]|uniref:Uncharacterized protein n=1 Tax=Caerostris extrusa TaxID=172846 RepID=A0AAV4Y217_CAEEX|nr:hypothetical protein CEXT_281481 [Caerostris extrusa]